MARRPDMDVAVLCDRLEHVDDLPASVRRRVRGPLPASIDRAVRSIFPPRWLHDFDLIHSPTIYGPFFRWPRELPAVVTVHDLIPLILPDTVSRANRVWFRHVAPRFVPDYDRFIAISQCTATDLTQWWPIGPDRIDVVPEASAFDPIDEPAQEESDEIVAVGTLEPRKNLPRAIDAFLRVVEQNPALPDRLVLVGQWGWEGSPLRSRIESAGDRVRVTGHLPDEDLRRRYRHAKALLFPSLYEGFGLPVVEAMGLGCPVIASRASSIPEVGGAAVEYFDPESVDDIARTIERVLTDAPLRNRLRLAGLERARRFSWDATAQATAAVYEKAISR